MNEKELEILRQFFGAYFHQDWGMDAENSEQILQLYLNEEREAEELNQLAHLIFEYGRTHLTDEALEKHLLKELGCYYLPSANNNSAHAWLNELESRLRGREK